MLVGLPSMVAAQPLANASETTSAEGFVASTSSFNQSAADLDVPELKPLLEIYGRGKDTNAQDRQKLARAAWQLTGGTFGSRQQLYERLHSGDPYVLMARSYDLYDKRRVVDSVNRLLGTSFKA